MKSSRVLGLRRPALVSSASFTTAAHERNIEAGLLLIANRLHPFQGSRHGPPRP